MSSITPPISSPLADTGSADASQTSHASGTGSATQTITLTYPGYWQRRSYFDWLFAVIVLVGGIWAFMRYGQAMDGYEKAILAGALPAMIWAGWFWRPSAWLMLVVAAFSLLGIALYQGDLARAEQVLVLKYVLSSQSAILWMCMLMFMSTIFYWVGLLMKARSGHVMQDGAAVVAANTPQYMGTWLAWASVGMALIGTMVRWYESHHIGAGIGHIPVSNLYEVFVLFCWMTTLFYLYYEQQYRHRALGAFVMLIVSAAVAFLLWYALVRDAHTIQPLVPALQSWWMKLHVPANFVGYGMFALAAMVALAWLLKTASVRALWTGLVAVPVVAMLAVLLAALLMGQSTDPTVAATTAALYKTVRTMLIVAVFLLVMVLLRAPISRHTPSIDVMDDVMYKSIAVGFAFFTIATVLGALWADKAWGGYWSWDPKETWALIVWLNYAAWLHMRLIKGLRGTLAAWWVLVGLLVVTFAFVGVNMFLSGLHSYGAL